MPRRMTRRLTLLLDQLLPASEIAVLDGAVQVHDALLESLEQIEIQGAVVDHLAELERQPGPDERDEIRERIHQAVDTSTDSVANRHRLHEGHDDVRARRHPPEPERLPEILPALLDAIVLRGVEQATDPERAVDQEPRHLACRSEEFPLKEAVDHPGHEGDVIEAVADHHFEGFRHDYVVNLRDRLQDQAIGLPIELENLLVESLPGIVVLVIRR